MSRLDSIRRAWVRMAEVSAEDFDRHLSNGNVVAARKANLAYTGACRGLRQLRFLADLQKAGERA